MLPYLGALEAFQTIMDNLPVPYQLFVYSCLGFFVLGAIFCAIIRHL